MTEIYYTKKSVSFYIIGMLAAFLFIPSIILILWDEYFYGFLLVIFWFSLFTIKKGARINYKDRNIDVVFISYLWFKFYTTLIMDNYKSYRVKTIHESFSLNTRVQTTHIDRVYYVIELCNLNGNYDRIALSDLKTIISIEEKIKSEFGLVKFKKSVKSEDGLYNY